ncbi:MAG: diguanylate cyclase [Sideroxydans sp.]|jgi:diguanylate cyclase (GGDEF)-like protein
MDFQAFPTIGSIAQKAILRGDIDLTVQAAAKLMQEKNVSSIIIEHEQDKFVFSIEELLAYIHAGGDQRTTLRKAPLRKIDCMNEKERVLGALEFLEKQGQRYLGVLDSRGVLVGIVTFSDILQSIDPTVLMDRKTVGQIISRSMPVLFTADWILADVIHHLKKMEDSIIVVEEGRPVGVITSKDAFGIMTSNQGTHLPLSHYMKSPVITTPIHVSINDALLQLRDSHIKRAIVVDDQQKVVGVVTQSELIGFAYGSWVNLMKNHTAELHEILEMLEEKNQGLERLTLTDVLTGLGNRRMLHQQMEEEIERMRRYNAETFSLVVIDVDRFKDVNDNFGHLVGDEVLKAIADEMNGLVRKSDLAVRWGGEEFAVLLSSSPLSAATSFANRLRTIIEDRVFVDGAKVTISAGVGEYSVEEDEKTFFYRVDQALYKAKAKGRNRVVTSKHP